MMQKTSEVRIQAIARKTDQNARNQILSNIQMVKCQVFRSRPENPAFANQTCFHYYNNRLVWYVDPTAVS